MKFIIPDVEKTFGRMIYMGCEKVYEYVDRKKTDKVIGYLYKVGSSEQGQEISVKIMKSIQVENYNFGDEVEFLNLQVKPYAIPVNERFANVGYSIVAEDIVSAVSVRNV